MVPHRLASGNRALSQSVTAPNGASAQACREVADGLAELLRHDISEWTEHGFSLTKLRTVRRVLHGQIAGIDVFAKVFRADTIAARSRASLREAKGAREAANLATMRELGIAAVEPLAFGHAIDSEQRCSFLLTRAVPAEPFTFAASAEIAARAGRVVRQLHDLGVLPADLHPGNLLVSRGGGDDPKGDGEVHLCDLTSVRRVGAPSLRARAHGLAFFCNPIDGGPLDAIARPFLNGYRSVGAPLAKDLDELLALATRQLRASSVRSFGRRAMRSCKHTEAEPRRRARPRWFWHLPQTDASRDACRAFDAGEHEPRRSGRRGAVYLSPTLAVKDREAGKARKLWTAAYLLQFARVPTAAPLALRLHAGRGQVFSQRFQHPDLATELRQGTLPAEDVPQLARGLGRAIGRMHGHGLRNRDLKFDNLVRTDTADQLAMVDLDGVQLHGAEDTRGAGRDLGRLLAAFHNAGSPGGAATIRSFVWCYVRMRRRLLQAPPIPRILMRAEQRAREWTAVHR
ncbi:MAG: lipopolysaccharide kinase InaA family protein [Planctomycetota bacterium]